MQIEDVSAGDKVILKTSEQTFTGIVMPRPTLLDQTILVLKLENGYNIGISKQKVESVEKVGVVDPIPVVQKDLTHNPKLPNVAVLSFGGTISSKIDYRTGGVVADYTASQLIDMMPEIESIANIVPLHYSSKMSEDFEPSDWQQIAMAVSEQLNDSSITGVVVTQGTDTLHFSTSAVSFMLGKINKPVIFTAAQKSIDRGSSDGFENIIFAIKAAANWDGACVVTCMHEHMDDGANILIRGTKVRKMHTSRRDAFRPINAEALARVTHSNLENLHLDYPKRKECVVSPKTSFAKVALVYVYPGIKGEQLNFIIQNNYKGVVIASTALGHYPESLLPKIQELLDKGIVVVNATQTLYGHVHEYVYSRLRDESIGMGIVFAQDMLPETAYTKLGWVLGNCESHEVALTTFKENLQGEYSVEHTADMFLN